MHKLQKNKSLNYPKYIITTDTINYSKDGITHMNILISLKKRIFKKKV